MTKNLEGLRCKLSEEMSLVGQARILAINRLRDLNRIKGRFCAQAYFFSNSAHPG